MFPQFAVSQNESYGRFFCAGVTASSAVAVWKHCPGSHAEQTVCCSGYDVEVWEKKKEGRARLCSLKSIIVIWWYIPSSISKKKFGGSKKWSEKIMFGKDPKMLPACPHHFSAEIRPVWARLWHVWWILAVFWLNNAQEKAFFSKNKKFIPEGIKKHAEGFITMPQCRFPAHTRVACPIIFCFTCGKPALCVLHLLQHHAAQRSPDIETNARYRLFSLLFSSSLV